jgi:homoserine kinase
MKPIKISVPATSANLGPGFDCLGLALDLWNHAEFTLSGESVQVEINGFGADTLSTDEQNLIVQAARTVYRTVSIPPPSGLVIRCRNTFPPESGLGSSSSAILLGLLGANALLDQPLTPDQILTLANDIEGHPDNVTPALLGGLTISTVQNNQVIARKIPVGPIFIAVTVPKFDLSTHAARAALPKQVPLPDAVYNLGRTALVVEALRTGDLSLLANVMDDRLHQPYRLPLIPGGVAAFEAARGAGALAVALSGAGPGVIAFTDGKSKAESSAAAMGKAFRAAGLESWKCVTRVSEDGAKVGSV